MKFTYELLGRINPYFVVNYFDIHIRQPYVPGVPRIVLQRTHVRTGRIYHYEDPFDIFAVSEIKDLINTYITP